MGDLFLLRTSLLGLLRPVRLALALGLVAAPALLALAMRAASPARFQPESVYNALAAGLVFGFLLVIVAVVFGTGTIAAELEQKTIVYLLTRPTPRWRIALAKFLAGWAAITLLLWLSALLLALATYGPGRLAASPLARDCAVLPVGAAAYGALSLLLATLFRRPLLGGLLYAFGWESWAPNLSGHFEKLSLMAYLRVLAPHPEPEGESIDMGRLLDSFNLNPATISPSLAQAVLAGVILTGLAAALLVFSLREYIPGDENS